MTDRVVKTLRVLDALTMSPAVDEELVDQVARILHDEGQVWPRAALAVVVQAVQAQAEPRVANIDAPAPAGPTGWRRWAWQGVRWLKTPWDTQEAWLVRTTPPPLAAPLPLPSVAKRRKTMVLPHPYRPTTPEAALAHWAMLFRDLRRGRAAFVQHGVVAHPLSPVDWALLKEAAGHVPAGHLDDPLPSAFDDQTKRCPLADTLPSVAQTLLGKAEGEASPPDLPLFSALLDLGANPDRPMKACTRLIPSLTGEWEHPSIRQWLAQAHQLDVLQSIGRPLPPVRRMSQSLLAWALLPGRQERTWRTQRARVLATVAWIFEQEADAHDHHVQVLRTMASRGHPLTEPVRKLMQTARGPLTEVDVDARVAG